MHTNGQLSSWAAFLRSLELRFATSYFDDPQGALFKLSQTDSVRDYQAKFKNLANCVHGLSTPFYLSYFIFGLKPEIQLEVIPFRPNSLTEAISLAKLQEKKLFATKPKSGYVATTTTTPFNVTSSTTSRMVGPSITNTSTKGLLPTPINSQIRKLSFADLQARRENGLCYYREERFTPRHRCQK